MTDRAQSSSNVAPGKQMLSKFLTLGDTRLVESSPFQLARINFSILLVSDAVKPASEGFEGDEDRDR